MTPSERRRAALRGELPNCLIDALDLNVVREQRAKQAERAAARWHQDPITIRVPGNVPERATLRAFRRALKVAGFRTATHDHTTSIDFVARGDESAKSSTDSASPSSVGLPHAYARIAWHVTTSEHAWHVSSAFFATPPERRAARGIVYLTPNLRVRQGRGTSLVVERRTGARGGWS